MSDNCQVCETLGRWAMAWGSELELSFLGSESLVLDAIFHARNGLAIEIRLEDLGSTTQR